MGNQSGHTGGSSKLTPGVRPLELNGGLPVWIYNIKMKILNLYAGIGGNRKLWTPNGDEHSITAVEYKPEIAAKYKEFFPNDTVVVVDAHQYLIDHYYEFDFIWSSPPCPTHTRMNVANSLSPYKDNSKQLKQGGGD